ncbi:MAG: UvrD-helicase domain-containing protein [Verrucomicrobia bacterium]|nr:UvrD-helicase domain-containing protein [Verrucomicrobiota bacterium]
MLNLSSLNPQQRQAVETVHGPVLILAGAGTGKTRVITYRIAHLIERGVAPGHILAVTFTNKAAREMKERVAQLLPRRAAAHDTPEATGPAISTFHALGARLLRRHIERLGYKKNFTIYNESEQLGALRKILSRLSAPGEKTDPNAVLRFLSRLKNGSLADGAFADESGAALARHIRARYASALRACNAVDFDDLLLLTLRLFEEHPAVLESCRDAYRHIMVDEYQDTNALQFRIVQLLAAKHRNLCVVGDDDQSIYGWRGAQIANLLDLDKHFADVKIIKLEQNYRSTRCILDAANALIRHNTRRRGKRLWSRQGHGDPIRLHTFENDDDEARTVVEEIEFARLARRIPWRHHAILFRTNPQSRPLEIALRAAHVPYHLIGGQSFFDRREVRDLLAYLKVLLNPHDEVSLLRIANVPARGLSEPTMERLLAASQQRHCSVYAAMRHPEVQAQFPPRARQAIRAFLDFLDKTRAPLTANPALPLRPWAERVLAELGYVDDLRRSEKNAETADNRVRHLKELLAELDAPTIDPAAPAEERLQNVLEDLALNAERDDDEERRDDAVTLITIHSCKGLEFPHVHLVGLEEGLLPHARSKEEGTLDEERRLFYVAITRAMTSLTLSHCLSRKKYGQALPCHPSSFLRELPPDLLEDASHSASRPVDVRRGKDYFSAMRSAVG